MQDAWILLLLLLGGGALGGGSSSGAEEPEEEPIPDDIYDDTLDADNGVVQGSSGNDNIFGWLEENGITGTESDDTFPDDTINAGDGADLVFGGNGEDDIAGEGGNDMLSGGTGDDTLDGGMGEDTLSGDSGSDQLTGGDGDDVFVIEDPQENDDDDDDEQFDEMFRVQTSGDEEVEISEILEPMPVPKPIGDTITDFSNEEGNRDFVDLTSHFRSLEEAKEAYDSETGQMELADEILQFEPGIEANFTTQTTGLAANVAPEAVDDTIDVDYNPYRPSPIFLEVVTGQEILQGFVTDFEGPESAYGPDTDADGDVSDLQISKVNGQEIEPGTPVVLSNGVELSLQRNGQTLSLDLDFRDDEISRSFESDDQDYPSQVDFTYNIVDKFGAESNAATVTVNLIYLLPV
jgi:hypothetical protein